jgi:hypothetical protein
VIFHASHWIALAYFVAFELSTAILSGQNSSLSRSSGGSYQPQSLNCEGGVMGQQDQKNGSHVELGFCYSGEDRFLVAPLA